ncbi:hypothetical protein EW146_g7858 [Bondarzewia mesenterica]|uniref:Uncharacterized protein n=1 Tax=Bondarzewia mesenterica TaxID=1095465 RepID=A0A4S4LJ33_9AGAM|nr:hypothetical protein EW146_g7858 [Bondarzewia mesenterica]
MAPHSNNSITPSVIVAAVFVGILSVAIVLFFIHICARGKGRLFQKHAPGRADSDCESVHSGDTTLAEDPSRKSGKETPSSDSFTLSPDSPVFFAMKSEDSEVGSMQMILTPPTPAKPERGGRDSPEM